MALAKHLQQMKGLLRLVYSAKKLAFLPTVIPHEILERGISEVTAAVFGNITFTMTEYGPDSFIIVLFVAGNEVRPFPVLFEGYDFRKLINFELLVFRRMGIIKSPLFKRNVSADKME